MAIIVKDTFIGPANTHLNGGHKADTGQDWTQAAVRLGYTYVGFCLDGSGKCKNDESYNITGNCCFVDSGYNTGIIISANIYNPTNYDGLEFWDIGYGWGGCYAFTEWAPGVIYLHAYSGVLLGTVSYSPSSGDLWEVDLGVTIPGHLVCKIAGNVLFIIAMTFPVYTNHGLVNYPSSSNSSLRWSNFQIQTFTPPTISNLSVTDGSTAGGYDTIITGTNFTGTTAVNFGSTPATAFTINSATQITATVPAHVAGAVNVSVTNPYGTATLTNGFTYHTPTLSACTPNYGTNAGGTAVTISGTYLTGVTGVTFGGVTATSVVVVSDSSITCVTPVGTIGYVNVVTSNPVDSGTINNGFQYMTSPSIDSVNPSTGSENGNDIVYIFGQNFTGATAVQFGSVNATSFVVLNSNLIKAYTPKGSGIVNVIVSSAVGTSTFINGFTYIQTKTLIIDGVTIPNRFILEMGKITETEEVYSASQQYIPSDLQVVLDSEVGKFALIQKGYFQNRIIFNAPISVSYKGRVLFSGTIREVEEQQKERHLTITAHTKFGYINQLPNITASYTAQIPAYIIKDLLITVAGLKQSDLDQNSFNFANEYQSLHSASITISTTATSQVNAMTLIKNLLDLSGCTLIDRQGVLYLHQYRYDVDFNSTFYDYAINDSMIRDAPPTEMDVPYTSVKNAVSIVWASGTYTDTSNGTQLYSFNGGSGSIVIPTLVSATFFGNQIKYKNFYRKKTLSWSMKENFNFMSTAEKVLYCSYIYQITKKVYDTLNRVINFEGTRDVKI